MAERSGRPVASSWIARATSCRAWAVVSAGLFLKQETQAPQEQMRQKGMQQVMMPTLPGTRFEMIQSDFTFCFFQCSLNRPSHSGEVRQFGLWIISWCVAQIIFGLRLRAKRTTQDRPTARA